MAGFLLCAALLAAAGMCVLWRLAERDVVELEQTVRGQRRQLTALGAELEALTVGAPPAAAAALTPDDPDLLHAEISAYLRHHGGRDA